MTAMCSDDKVPKQVKITNYVSRPKRKFVEGIVTVEVLGNTLYSEYLATTI